MAKIFVGISGWTFPPWRGKFYPKDVTQKRELEYASRQFNSIEINGTFYSLQRPGTFQNWHDQTPKEFVFSVKAPQYITHVRRLKEIEEPLANFFASGLLCLKRKLGPILWQFPPNVMLKDDRFKKFLSLLPYDSKSASKLAKRHGAKVEGRSWTKVDGDFPVRHAFEFRHPSFNTPEFLDMLRRRNVGFVCSHANKKAPYVEEPTADFAYVRFHGEGKGYAKGYPDKALSEWAKRIQAWSKLDVYAYFTVDAKVHSPASAKKLVSKLSDKS